MLSSSHVYALACSGPSTADGILIVATVDTTFFANCPSHRLYSLLAILIASSPPHVSIVLVYRPPPASSAIQVAGVYRAECDIGGLAVQMRGGGEPGGVGDINTMRDIVYALPEYSHEPSDEPPPPLFSCQVEMKRHGRGGARGAAGLSVRSSLQPMRVLLTARQVSLLRRFFARSVSAMHETQSSVCLLCGNLREDTSCKCDRVAADAAAAAAAALATAASAGATGAGGDGTPLWLRLVRDSTPLNARIRWTLPVVGCIADTGRRAGGGADQGGDPTTSTPTLTVLRLGTIKIDPDASLTQEGAVDRHTASWCDVAVDEVTVPSINQLE
jgi:hypothetical protein